MQQQIASGARSSWFCSALVLALPAILGIGSASAEQPPSPCHPNPNAAANRSTVATHGEVINLPGPLKDRLIQLADRPHTYLPLQVFAEADGAGQLFQYYLLDTTGFEPNVFNTIFPRVNDHVQLTVAETVEDRWRQEEACIVHGEMSVKTSLKARGLLDRSVARAWAPAPGARRRRLASPSWPL